MTGVLHGAIENIVFGQPVTLAAAQHQQIRFDARTLPRCTSTIRASGGPTVTARRISTTLHLEFNAGKTVSDPQEVDFGVRKISY